MSAPVAACFGAFIGLLFGIGWAAYHGLETKGAAMRRLRRKHPSWFDPTTPIEYPQEDISMPDLSGIEVES